ncbi:MAG: 16S rRNA (cytosine(967)-C(5))-methyltransferase RsmB [Solirubrobacteraceae bacterium]
MSVRSSSVAPARACAQAVIADVCTRAAFADRALRAHVAGLDQRDRQLAMRLVYGTVQRQMTLDYLIESFSERPVSKLDHAVRDVLRMGLYELCYTDGAPDRAIVHDAVELARDAGSHGHGLVNAILRRGAREGRQLLEKLPDQTADEAALAHSHPSWIARHFFRELGAEQARALLGADNQPAETALRANTLCCQPAALAAELPVRCHNDPNLAEALIIDDPFDARSCPQWRTGAFMAQSRASMLVAHVLDPRPDERVLDLCAAPGAKSTHLAALMAGRGAVIAVERSPKRAAELAENVRRMHARSVHVQEAHAATPRANDDLFDRVLVDPPCSGLGTLQNHPDLRWRMNEQTLHRLAGVQQAILAAGAQALRPGGVLVYSTCTISETENECLIDAFLDRHPDFHIEQPPPQLQAPLHPTRTSDFVLTLPHRDRTQGFFIARLRRED